MSNDVSAPEDEQLELDLGQLPGGWPQPSKPS